MKKLDKIIDEGMFWFCIIVGNLMIWAVFSMMFFMLWQVSKFAIVIPLLFILVLRHILWDYIRGIFTLNKEVLPGRHFHL